MRKEYQPGELQAAIQANDTYSTIVAVGFTDGGIPTIIEIEGRGQKQDFYENSVFDLVRTRKTPRQWFLDGPYAAEWPEERKYHDPERKMTVDVSWYLFQGMRTPLRSLWIAPHLRIVTRKPEDLTGIELLAELPPAYALDGHFQRILELAYEGLFTWCKQCEEFESYASKVHNRHVEIAVEEHEERAFFCEQCCLYSKGCPHFATNEAFWAQLRSARQ